MFSLPFASGYEQHVKALEARIAELEAENAQLKRELEALPACQKTLDVAREDMQVLKRERDAARKMYNMLDVGLLELMPTETHDPEDPARTVGNVRKMFESFSQYRCDALNMLNDKENELDKARVTLGAVVTKIESMLERHERQLSVDQRGRLYAIAGIALEALHETAPDETVEIPDKITGQDDYDYYSAKIAQVNRAVGQDGD